MNNKKITISSVGDISFAGGFSERPELLHSWLADDVRKFLNADIKIANMEYVLLPDGETWPGGLCLAEPAVSLEALKYAGFNVLTLGNNHILDFKCEKGMLATMKLLNDSGIKHCGAGMNIQDARAPAILEVRRKKVAVFSRLHDYSFISVKHITATEKSAGVALLDLNEITESIRHQKEKGQADIVVLCLHWGMQNVHDHSHVVHELGKNLLDGGVDLVLGSHSHLVQGLALHNGKFCFYGQGNFYFYPYPLVGHPPNGLLYGPEAVRHRIAAASKFTYDGNGWASEIVTTFQCPYNERIVILPQATEIKFRRMIEGRWSRWRPFAFHAAWRVEIIKTHFGSILCNLAKMNFCVIRWYLNPFNWIKIIFQIIKPGSLG